MENDIIYILDFLKKNYYIIIPKFAFIIIFMQRKN